MPQYIIVMSYVPLGTLTQFLKENSIDWFTLCRMYHSTASGLAHLHSDIVKGGRTLPGIIKFDFLKERHEGKPYYRHSTEVHS